MSVQSALTYFFLKRTKISSFEMASTVTKQQYYRRLMKEQKSKTSSAQATRVTHSLARYNALDQLICVLCNVQVKSAIRWSTHLQSRKHKDCVAAIKSAKAPPTSSSVTLGNVPVGQPAGKLRVDEVGEGCDTSDVPMDSRKGKRRLESDVTNDSPPPPKKKSKRRRAAQSATPTTGSSLPAGFFDSSVSKRFHPHGEEVYYESSDSEGEEPTAAGAGPSTSKGTEQPSSPTSNVPADFFDRGSENTPSQPKNSDGGSDGKGKALPEGFFDDPKMDAKARKVEYKDPMTEEWERFQKSIQKEEDISEVILFEGDEEAMEERAVEEVNQQVDCFTKAEKLRQRHEQLLAGRESGQAALNDRQHMDTRQQENSSEDEEDFDEFLNWRAKVS